MVSIPPTDSRHSIEYPDVIAQLIVFYLRERDRSLSHVFEIKLLL